MPPLVEFAVIRQEDFRHDAEHAAAMDRDRAIVEPSLPPQRRADDEHRQQVFAFRESADRSAPRPRRAPRPGTADRRSSRPTATAREIPSARSPPRRRPQQRERLVAVFRRLGDGDLRHARADPHELVTVRRKEGRHRRAARQRLIHRRNLALRDPLRKRLLPCHRWPTQLTGPLPLLKRPRHWGVAARARAGLASTRLAAAIGPRPWRKRPEGLARPLASVPAPGPGGGSHAKSRPPLGPGIVPVHAFLVSTGLVALAEIGDKTQLLALMLAARFRRPWPIIAGILIATLANHAGAGVAGMLARQPAHRRMAALGCRAVVSGDGGLGAVPRPA